MADHFDVALSFAGEDRRFVAAVAERLKIAHPHIRVFYDGDDETQVELWGKDLPEALDEIYRKGSRYAVLFVSAHYAAKMWTRLERRSAIARALQEKREYILPAHFDDTELPALPPTIQSV